MEIKVFYESTKILNLNFSFSKGKKVFTSFILFILCCTFIFSQNSISYVVGDIQPGIYENGRKFLTFVANPMEKIEPDGLEPVALFEETDEENPTLPSGAEYSVLQTTNNTNNKAEVLSKVGVQNSTLKLFYSFYYDGEFVLEQDQEPYFIAQIEDNLYLQFWTSNPEFPNFWIPGGNMTDIALFPARRLEKLTGY